MISINKKLFILCICIGSVILSLSLFNVINYYSSSNQILESTTYTDNSNLISVYIENEEGNYVLSETSNFDQGTDYVYNEEKSYCVNESVLSYNTDTSKISVTASGTDNCYVYFDAKPLILLSEQILMNEENEDGNTFTTVEAAITYIESKDTPDFSTIADEDEGIFATEDNDGTTYYFRGATEDNYVEFAGMLWRIIRIDGQGNIKLMLYNTSTDGTSYESVGTDFTTGLLSYVETWYENNLQASYEKYLVSTDYCQDENIDSSLALYNLKNDGTTESTFSNLIDYNDSDYNIVQIIPSENYFSGSYYRLINYSPSLLCDTTISNISEYNAYAGVISSDEIAFAGAVYGKKNYLFYLYTNGNWWWFTNNKFTLNYMMGEDHDSSADIYILFADGEFDGAATYTADVIPTISLSYEVLFSEGNGTIESPYKIVETE